MCYFDPECTEFKGYKKWRSLALRQINARYKIVEADEHQGGIGSSDSSCECKVKLPGEVCMCNRYSPSRSLEDDMEDFDDLCSPVENHEMDKQQDHVHFKESDVECSKDKDFTNKKSEINDLDDYASMKFQEQLDAVERLVEYMVMRGNDRNRSVAKPKLLGIKNVVYMNDLKRFGVLGNGKGISFSNNPRIMTPKVVFFTVFVVVALVFYFF